MGVITVSRDENSRELQRLERSLPQPIRRGLLDWYIDMLTGGLELLIQKENGVPALFGFHFCSNTILAVHREKGEMMYSQQLLEQSCGCSCHGF
jgi:hypothetical protein